MKKSGVLLGGLLVTAGIQAVPRPNIVFFLADDISQEDFGCYGHPTVRTPNTDALAASGMRFDNAYLTTSSCSPSRCSIITGRYPHNTGAPELHVKLPKSQIRFPELLRKVGYYAVLSGKNDMFKKSDVGESFDKITKGGGPGGEEDWVEHVRNRPKDKPFFFWFASNDAHRPWKQSENLKGYHPEEVVVPPYLIDSDITRQDLAEYYHEVSRFDHYIGLVTAELKKQGVLEHTLIVIGADNGRPFPRCKTRLYDSGIKTPWVVSYPALITEPSVSKSLVSVIDLSATCLELAGVDKPDCIQGQSFVPILRDPGTTVRELIFAEHNWHVYKAHERMIRFGDWVYIKNNYPDQLNLSSESDGSNDSGAELWKAHASRKTTPQQELAFADPCPAEELFLLSKDPDQFVNLAANPEYAEMLVKARKHLAKWTELTGDTVPSKPTPHRYAPPKINKGKFIEHGRSDDKTPHREMPGEAKGAMHVNHPGPVYLEEVRGVQ
jgi:arylsulfatase